jgi:hypothetical protein
VNAKLVVDRAGWSAASTIKVSLLSPDATEAAALNITSISPADASLQATTANEGFYTSTSCGEWDACSQSESFLHAVGDVLGASGFCGDQPCSLAGSGRGMGYCVRSRECRDPCGRHTVSDEPQPADMARGSLDTDLVDEKGRLETVNFVGLQLFPRMHVEPKLGHVFMSGREAIPFSLIRKLST